MTARTWVGGTAATAQLVTTTISNVWAASDTITTTLTDESGNATTVVSTATGTSIETDVRDVHLANLQADTQTEFAKITWAASGTTAITATAKISGRPFYLATTVVTAGSGSVADVTTTANAGPNDWNTAANWQGGVVPVTGNNDTVAISSGNYSILYGLQVSITIDSFKISDQYYGSIGDMSGPHYLQIVVTSGSDPVVIFSGSGANYLFELSATTVVVRNASGGTNAIRLKGTSSVTTMVVSGRMVNGLITVLSGGFAITNLYMIDCPNARLVLNNDTTATSMSIEQNSGTLELNDRVIGTYNGDGGSMKHTGNRAGGTINGRGGVVDLRAWNTTYTKINGMGATVFVGREIQKNQTITNTTIYSGSLVEESSGGGGVVYTNPILVYGGTINASAARTVTP